MNSLAAQVFVFFFGGFETSSTTMTFCLYELSLHQDIQDRLRQEIDVVLQKHDGKLTYEAIQEMEYLDKVVSGKTHSCKYVYIFRKQDNVFLSNANVSVTTVRNLRNFAIKLRSNKKAVSYFEKFSSRLSSIFFLIIIFVQITYRPSTFACCNRFLLT